MCARAAWFKTHEALRKDMKDLHAAVDSMEKHETDGAPAITKARTHLRSVRSSVAAQSPQG